MDIGNDIICIHCNTELLDNLINCSGQCNRCFHYTCVGFTRSAFDAYKKVVGLRWHCPDCLNDFKGFLEKLDELTATVNEIKALIDLGGMVKAAINEAIVATDSAGHFSGKPSAASTVRRELQDTGKKAKRRSNQRKSKKKVAKTSTPVTGTNKVSMESREAAENISLVSLIASDSIDDANNTVVPTNNNTNDNPSTRGIRTVETRTYLWLNGFHHDTTTSQIIKLVADTMNVEESEVICRSLKSGRREYTEFDQVSFRVGLKTKDLRDALTTDKWPKGIICKLFKSKNCSTRLPVKLN